MKAIVLVRWFGGKYRYLNIGCKLFWCATIYELIWLWDLLWIWYPIFYQYDSRLESFWLLFILVLLRLCRCCHLRICLIYPCFEAQISWFIAGCILYFLFCLAGLLNQNKIIHVCFLFLWEQSVGVSWWNIFSWICTGDGHFHGTMSWLILLELPLEFWSIFLSRE